MPKRKVPTAPSHLLTTEPTLAQHREERRTLKGAYKASERELAPRNRVDNSAHYTGSTDKTSIADRSYAAKLRGDKEASAWMKRHQWGLKFA